MGQDLLVECPTYPSITIQHPKHKNYRNIQQTDIQSTQELQKYFSDSLSGVTLIQVLETMNRNGHSQSNTLLPRSDPQYTVPQINKPDHTQSDEHVACGVHI